MTRKQIVSHSVQFACFMVFFAATFPAMIVPGYKYGSCHAGYQSFSLFFGIVAAVLACIQWIPQIILTYKKKAAGAFSMTAMLI